MGLTEMTIRDFTDLLASDAPAPGGGASAALSGALGVALTSMVAALTVDKKVYEEHRELMEQIMTQAEGLRQGLVYMIDKDAETFNSFGAVMALPKDTDAQKAKRAEAMQTALKNCTLIPFEIMRCAFSALELTERAMGKSNKTVISDLGVAAISLKAAVQSAWLNVLVNTGSIKDKDFAEKYRNDGRKILEAAVPLADKIYSEVLNKL